MKLRIVKDDQNRLLYVKINELGKGVFRENLHVMSRCREDAKDIFLVRMQG